MGENTPKITIDIFKTKSAEDFTAALSDPEGKLEVGSPCAYTASFAMALLSRAAKLSAAAGVQGERIDYIIRNSESIRKYMIHLIDEDLKCRAPLKRALREGDARAIEACRHSAVSICAEIVNMLSQMLELAKELLGMCPDEAKQYIAESAHLSLAAIQAARVFIVATSDKCVDDTYRFVIRRENEITISAAQETAAEIIAAVEEVI